MGKHLTLKERFYIEMELKKKTPVSQIASELGFHRSTIYKEIKRGLYEHLDTSYTTTLVYASDKAQSLRDCLSHNKGRKKKLLSDDPYLQELKEYIIQEHYSPWAARTSIAENKICTKTLYNYIHAGYIPGLNVQSLPYAKPHKKKKKAKRVKRPFSRGRSIEERPKEILSRDVYGHWEMDTVYSSKDDRSCLLVLSERMTREELIFKLKDRTSDSVIRALDSYERKLGTPAFRNKFLTITCDNGMEFADWESIERSCRTKGRRTITYFCHPYCSQERGTNENINRMIRRWIPKGDDIGLYSTKEIAGIQEWINNYPRTLFDGHSSLDFRGCVLANSDFSP